MIDRRSLERLAGKYRVLVALRLRREALEATGARCFDAEEAAARRRAFRRIARAFPGALRELDVCSAALLQRRLEEVERALAGGPPAAWIPIAIDFHRSLREALLIKGWLARRRAGATDADLAALARLVDRLDRLRPPAARPHRPSTAAGWRALAERHARPREGRLLPDVWRALERRHGLARAAMERMLFGTR